jgi:large subunit ribosomal protein L24
MDKILRRVRMAERQVIRRRKKLATTEFLEETKRKSIRETKDLHEDAVSAIQEARKARRDGWEMGPIAPRRETPRVSDGNFTELVEWGTVKPTRALPGLPLSPKALEDRCAWAGGSEFLCLAEGDRVVITEGAMKGSLDKITKINLQTGTVRLADARVSSFLSLSSYQVRSVADTVTLDPRPTSQCQPG